ncbi:1-acyl-sn-glycerol-3-phosphate acyltransferase 3 [Cynara cardunculus var. scolymus]|uniref:1-acyl-sn-glycerol-3-phosphate acyltransferase 3 n=1 Tax=Cynara cardunculus var. scolymus TaxID=59895 RepID=UPI000D6232F9|nr:1-acyl-sn-glycerol-3-phosphate acyltransferase 3 [Cynara cardunculus var. scolymus]
MAVAAVVILPIGLLFLLSGLLINFLQAFLFILVRPFSNNMYRKVNAHLAELLWLEVIWLFDWWAHIKVDLYIDSETLELMGKEHALLVCNHKSDIDWLIGWVLAQRSGCLGSALALIKKSLKFLPVIGWSMWFTEYIFLERNWSKDKNTLKAGFENLRDFPMPFWLAVFVEGTRFTQAKLLAAQEYAVATKLPVPKNVLIPRTKGFVAAVNHLRSFVPAIYNCTVAIPKDEPLPTVLRMFGGRSSRVHVQIKRHLICDLPETDDAIRQWCRDIFIEKDASLELHHFKNSFEDMECHGIGRPKKSLFVVIVWSCVLIYGGVEFFKWCSFSWGTIAFCAVVLLVVVISMHVLILFSQSEKSNPPQEASAINSQDILKHKLLP